MWHEVQSHQLVKQNHRYPSIVKSFITPVCPPWLPTASSLFSRSVLSIGDSSNRCNCRWLSDSIQCLLTITATINGHCLPSSCCHTKGLPCTRTRRGIIFFAKIRVIISKVLDTFCASPCVTPSVSHYYEFTLFKKPHRKMGINNGTPNPASALSSYSICSGDLSLCLEEKLH